MSVTTRLIMDIDNALEVLNVAHNDKVQRVDKIGVVNRKGGRSDRNIIY